jgi:thiamine-phosphate pyrophosphorylase
MRQLNPASGLYLVVSQDDCPGRDLLDVVGQAIAGGVRTVQLREKHLATREFVARAVALKALLAPLKVPLIINDRLDVALVCQADGLHVGQKDLHVEDARRWLPEGSWLGLSVSSVEDARAAQGFDIDYIGVGPVFPTTTKADANPPLGLAGLAAVRACSALPIVAIGGISHANGRDVMRAGADGLAVVSAICGHADPRAAAEMLAACCVVGQHLPSQRFVD